jgi:small subunit ribosomal protein S1
MDLIQAAKDVETLADSHSEIETEPEAEAREAVSIAENAIDAPEVTAEFPEAGQGTAEIPARDEDAAEPLEVHPESAEDAREVDTVRVEATEDLGDAPEAGEPVAEDVGEAAEAAAEPTEGLDERSTAAETFSEAAEVEEPEGEEISGEMGELDVEDWDYQRPKRGQIRTGVILSIGEQEIVIDVDAKRDGIVPYADMQRMGEEALARLSEGDEVMVYILRPEDQDGNLLVSLYQARQAQSWQRAAALAEEGETWEGEVTGYNKGGLVVPVDDVRGFVPASQLTGFPQGLSQEQRLQRLSEMVGKSLRVKVIEINRRNRRLILSATAAEREWRQKRREELLEELREGEVRTGTVSSLCSFGAFVDLGGADGLVHLSELSWRRVRHPREAVRVGQEVDVYVMRLDHERKRIGLSLKRLQPEPWALVEDKYELGQLVEGLVTNVVEFGAFAEIEEGVEGLIHVSELTEQNISHPRDVVKKGDLLLLRIIRIDIRRRRLGLSLKRVLEAEWAEWAARMAVSASAEAGKTEKPTPAAEPEPEPDVEPGPEEAPEQAEDALEPVAEEEAAEIEEPEDAPDLEVDEEPDVEEMKPAAEEEPGVAEAEPEDAQPEAAEEAEAQSDAPDLEVDEEPDVDEMKPAAEEEPGVAEAEPEDVEPELLAAEAVVDDEPAEAEPGPEDAPKVTVEEDKDVELDATQHEPVIDSSPDDLAEPEGEEAEATEQEEPAGEAEPSEPESAPDVEEVVVRASEEPDDDSEPVEDDIPDALEDQAGDADEPPSSY